MERQRGVSVHERGAEEARAVFGTASCVPVPREESKLSRSVSIDAALNAKLDHRNCAAETDRMDIEYIEIESIEIEKEVTDYGSFFCNKGCG